MDTLNSVISDCFYVNDQKYNMNIVRNQLYTNLTDTQKRNMDESTQFNTILPNYHYHVPKNEQEKFIINNSQYCTPDRWAGNNYAIPVKIPISFGATINL